jgi:hypothetical protein
MEDSVVYQRLIKKGKEIGFEIGFELATAQHKANQREIIGYLGEERLGIVPRWHFEELEKVDGTERLNRICLSNLNCKSWDELVQIV